MASLIGP